MQLINRTNYQRQDQQISRENSKKQDSVKQSIDGIKKQVQSVKKINESPQQIESPKKLFDFPQKQIQTPKQQYGQKAYISQDPSLEEKDLNQNQLVDQYCKMLNQVDDPLNLLQIIKDIHEFNKNYINELSQNYYVLTDEDQNSLDQNQSEIKKKEIMLSQYKDQLLSFQEYIDQAHLDTSNNSLILNSLQNQLKEQCEYFEMLIAHKNDQKEAQWYAQKVEYDGKIKSLQNQISELSMNYQEQSGQLALSSQEYKKQSVFFQDLVQESELVKIQLSQEISKKQKLLVQVDSLMNQFQENIQEIQEFKLIMQESISKFELDNKSLNETLQQNYQSNCQLQNQVDVLTNDNNKQQKQIQNQYKSNEQLKSQLEDLKQENHLLKNQIQNFSQDQENNIKQIQILTEQKESMQNYYSMIENKIKQDYQQSELIFQQKNTELLEIKRNLETQNRVLTDNYEQISKQLELDYFNIQIEQFKSKEKIMTDEIDSLTLIISNQKQKEKMLINEIKSLQDMNSIQNELTDKLQKELGDLKAENLKLLQQMELDQQRIKQLANQVELQQNFVQEKKDQFNLYKDDNYAALMKIKQEITLQNQDLEKQNEILKENVAQMTAEIEQIITQSNQQKDQLEQQIINFDEEKNQRINDIKEQNITIGELNLLVEQYKAQLFENENQLSHLTMQCDLAINDKVKELELQNQSNFIQLTNQKNELQIQLQKLSEEWETRVNNLNEKNSQIQMQHINQIDILKSQIQSLESNDPQELKFQIDTLQKLIETKSSLLDQIIKKDQELQSSNEQLNQQNKQMFDSLNLQKQTFQDISIQQLDNYVKIDAMKKKIQELEFYLQQFIQCYIPKCNQFYEPVLDDETDLKLYEFLKTSICPIKFTRITKNQYNFGTKRIFVKITNDKLIVRLGVGYYPISNFIQVYTLSELNNQTITQKKFIEDLIENYKSSIDIVDDKLSQTMQRKSSLDNLTLNSSLIKITKTETSKQSWISPQSSRNSVILAQPSPKNSHRRLSSGQSINLDK